MSEKTSAALRGAARLVLALSWLALGSCGDAPSAASALVRPMREAAGDDRRDAIAADIAARGPDVVPVVLQGLRDPDAAVRACCVDVLASIEPMDARVFDAVSSLHADPDADVRVSVATAMPLASADPAMKAAALDRVLAILRDDPDPDVRLAVAGLLGACAIAFHMKREDASFDRVVRALSAVADGRDEEPRVREFAAKQRRRLAEEVILVPRDPPVGQPPGCRAARPGVMPESVTVGGPRRAWRDSGSKSGTSRQETKQEA